MVLDMVIESVPSSIDGNYFDLSYSINGLNTFGKSICDVESNCMAWLVSKVSVYWVRTWYLWSESIIISLVDSISNEGIKLDSYIASIGIFYL
jgi:hypothetical protein